MNRFKEFDLEELGIIEDALEDTPAGPVKRQEILSLLGEIIKQKQVLLKQQQQRTKKLQETARIVRNYIQ